MPDVIVIGGGVVGTTAAWQIAAAGAEVTLLERGALASGATGRSQGLVLPPDHGEMIRSGARAWSSTACSPTGASSDSTASRSGRSFSPRAEEQLASLDAVPHAVSGSMRRASPRPSRRSQPAWRRPSDRRRPQIRPRGARGVGGGRGARGGGRHPRPRRGEAARARRGRHRRRPDRRTGDPPRCRRVVAPAGADGRARASGAAGARLDRTPRSGAAAFCATSSTRPSTPSRSRLSPAGRSPWPISPPARSPSMGRRPCTRSASTRTPTAPSSSAHRGRPRSTRAPRAWPASARTPAARARWCRRRRVARWRPPGPDFGPSRTTASRTSAGSTTASWSAPDTEARESSPAPDPPASRPSSSWAGSRYTDPAPFRPDR